MAAAAALHGLSCLSRAAAVEAIRRVLHTTHNDAALFIVDAFGFVFAHPPHHFNGLQLHQLSVPVALTGAILGLIGRRLPVVPGPFWSRVSRNCDTSTILNGRDLGSHRRRISESVPRLLGPAPEIRMSQRMSQRR